MAQSDLEVCNRSIGKIGGEPLESLEDETPLAAFCAQNWPGKRAWLLGKYRWVFAKQIAPLTQLATAPANCPLPYAYQRPQDLAGAIHAARNGRDEQTSNPVRLDQLADFLASDTLGVWIEYTADREVSTWPPWFEEFAVTAFAVDVARRALRRNLAAELQVEAFGPPEAMGQGGLFLQAMQEDSRNAPQRSLCYQDGGDLVAARYGAGVGIGGGLSGGLFGGLPLVILPGNG